MHEGSADLRQFAARVASAAAAGFPGFDPQRGETVLAPDAPGRGHWVGAPSVVGDPESGRVLMAYRRRRPRDGSASERGYLAAIGASSDGGRSFEPIWQVTKEQVGSSSLERCCLRRGPAGDWLLYASWEEPPSSGRWRISVARADRAEDFDPAAFQPVLSPGDVGVAAVKDPWVICHDGALLMFVSTFITPQGPAPTSLASSEDGLHYVWRGETLSVGSGARWDAYQARLSCVVGWGEGFVGYYDGAGSRADDTEEHCGIVCSLDLRRWQRTSVEAPVLVSPHASGSLRYVDMVQIAGDWWAYYEYTRADGSHELRRSRLEMI